MKKAGLSKIHTSEKAFYSQLVASFRRALRIIGDESKSISNLQVSMKGLSDTSFNCKAYIMAKRRMHEVETQKAMSIILSRHNAWKAGGQQ